MLIALRLSALLTLATVWAALLAAQELTIRVPVHLVAQRALVFSSDNHILPGLRKADFHVEDNGRPQTFTVEEDVAAASIVLAVQTNRDIRQYIPFIAKTGSVFESLLAGATGEVAVLAYAGEVSVIKPFGSGDVQAALRTLRPRDKPARMLDAAAQAIALLSARPARRARALIVVGQPEDAGSETDLASVRRAAEAANVTVYTLTLPIAGKDFISDTFSLNGVSFAERGGFRADMDLGGLIAVLSRSANVASAADPFSVLTAATGGAQIRFRTQHQFEDAIAATGLQLHSAYVLSYPPTPARSGYHTVEISVRAPGARVYTRPGYWLDNAR